jgi:hypothetical protein
MTRLNRCFIRQAREKIAGAFAVRALLIAEISGCLAMRTFGPIGCVDSSGIYAATTQFAAGFATTAVCDPDVVPNAATLGTTRNGQISLHLLMIRPRRCFHMFQKGRSPDSGRVTKVPAD